MKKFLRMSGLFLAGLFSFCVLHSGANFAWSHSWSDQEVLTASELNAEFDNILNNFDPDGMDDASANATAMQATADPYPGSVESLATSLRGEMQRLRYLLTQITGKTYWYQDPVIDIATLYTFNRDGWTPAQETWTYLSATTITTASDLSSVLYVGDRIKITQTTAKYFVVTGITSSVITVTGGSNYSVANAAITTPYFSHAASPAGFPDWFDYTPTLDGFSVDPTNTVYRFSVKGRVCTLVVVQGSGTSDATNLTITSPIQAATKANARWGALCTQAVDNGATLTNPALALLASASSTINVYKDTTQANWTNANAKKVEFTLIYE